MKGNDGWSKAGKVWAYAAIFAATAAILVPLWVWYVEPHFGQVGRRPRGLGSLPVALILASAVTSAIARFLGISLAGRTVETRRKVGGGQSRGVIDEVVEMNTGGFYDKPPVAVLPFSLFVMSVLFVCLPPSPSSLNWSVAGAIASGGMTWFCLKLYSNPVLRLDDEGILGYPSGGFGVRHRFVPWDAIASYSIETTRDDFGRASRTALTFADSRGVPLLVLRPRTLPAKERERVVQFLAAKFPKVEVERPWEL